MFRIGGLVEEGSIVRGEGTEVSFQVTDTNQIGAGDAMTGVLPDLFAEGQGMIALGQMQGDTFVASEVLAKHDETYMPKEVIEALKEQGVYQDPDSRSQIPAILSAFGRLRRKSGLGRSQARLTLRQQVCTRGSFAFGERSCCLSQKLPRKSSPARAAL